MQVLEWDESQQEGVPTKSAHTNPEVQRVWADFAASAEFVPLGKLAKSPPPGVLFLVARSIPGKEAAVKDLLIGFARAIRKRGLAAAGSALTLQSDEDGTFLQIIEVRKPGNDRETTGSRDFQKVRTELQKVANVLDVSALHESGCAFASLALVSED
jgi:hypothetical protein